MAPGEPPEPVSPELNTPEEVIALLERLTNRNAMFRPKHALQALAAVNEVVRELDILSGTSLAKLILPNAPSSSTDASADGSSATLRDLAKRARLTVASSMDPSRNAPHGDLRGEVVPETLLCIQCSQDLKGVPVDSVCPECGLCLHENLRTDRLVVAPEYDLQRVMRGVRFAGRGLLGLAFPTFLITWLPVVFALFLPLTGNMLEVSAEVVRNHPAFGVSVLVFFSALICALLVYSAIGLHLMTSSDAILPHRKNLRMVVRWASRLIMGLSIVPVVGLGVMLIGLIPAMSLLRSMAKELPDRQLVKHTGGLMRFLIFAVTGMAALTLFLIFGNDIAHWGRITLALGVAGFAVCWFLLPFVMGLIAMVFFRFARGLQLALPRADALRQAAINAHGL